MVRWGLPADSVRVITTGIDRERYAPRTTVPGARAAEEPLRVLFLGTLAVHKGAHVLLDAWARLPAELRARGRLDLFGPPFRSDPGYVGRLRRDARASGAHLGGALGREEVASALRSADLLVVPSIWFENAPMVILEALAVRTPLAVSGLGGMAELVRPGHSGFHFRSGDADDLAATLAGVLREPGQLARLYPPGARERTFEDTLDDIEAVYAEVLGGAAP
jgi:glycosyltransferase involved in cell wall biosynthesis